MRGFDTVLQADSIEAHSGGVFVCGTYSLRRDEATGRRWREGLIHLACADDAEEWPRQSVACGGVLDLKWQRGGTLLASVESEAGLRLLRLDDGELQQVVRGRFDRQRRVLAAEAPENLINLSADWTLDGRRLAVSHDDGSVSVWDVNGGGAAELQCVQWWHAHDNEAWIAACHGEQPDVIWSGGDDAALRGWDLRAGTGRGQATFSAKGAAGVTAIQHWGGPVWAEGGYDECLRLWDERRTAKPLDTLAGLGGGVWRIKRHPQQAEPLWVLACMRGGFRVVAQEEGKLKCMFHHDAHEPEALAYGVDWLPERGRVVCCAFYDARCSIFDWPQRANV
jgi:diphthamide biosynthesis protein 7